MEIIGITGSAETSSVAEILSYDLGVEKVSLTDYLSKGLVKKLGSLKKESTKDYFIVEGPSLFFHKELFNLLDYKFYIVDKEANDESQKTMSGVVVLESPGKTAWYYRNQILDNMKISLEDL